MSELDDFRNCEAVLSRFITESDFKAIWGRFDDVEGGGQRWISLGSSEEILHFFGVTGRIEELCGEVEDYNEALDEKIRDSGEDSVKFEIEIEPIDELDIAASSIELKYTIPRPWQIPVTPPHELWTEEDYMPTVDDFGGLEEVEENYYSSPSQKPPMIYFLRDSSQNYHTRTIRDLEVDVLQRYPDPLQKFWSRYLKHDGSSRNTALIDFTKNEASTL